MISHGDGRGEIRRVFVAAEQIVPNGDAEPTDQNVKAPD
jgi:hypothetical protein